MSTSQTRFVSLAFMLLLPVAGVADDGVNVNDRGPVQESSLSEEALSSQRGRQGLQTTLSGVQVSNASLEATLSGNVTTETTTGANLTGDQAFSGARGIATIIQNSGNQVIIQNDVIINLHLQ